MTGSIHCAWVGDEFDAHYHVIKHSNVVDDVWADRFLRSLWEVKHHYPGGENIPIQEDMEDASEELEVDVTGDGCKHELEEEEVEEPQRVWSALAVPPVPTLPREPPPIHRRARTPPNR